MSRSMREIISEINLWQDKVFTQSTAESTATHLLMEANELYDDPYDEGEIADIFILLAAVAHKTNVDIEAAVERKMAINRLRTWGKPDKQGVVEHVRNTLVEVFAEDMDKDVVQVNFMKLDSEGKPYGIGNTGE